MLNMTRQVIGVLSVVLLATPPMGASARAEDTLDRLRSSGAISIGIGNAPPWAYLKPDGSAAGAAPEVAMAVLKKLGITNVKATIVEYGAMIPALNAGQFDLVAAGLYLNPQRCGAVLFSQPDLCDAAAFLVRRGNPLNLKSYEDVAKNPKARLTTCGGCVEEGYARAAGIPDDRLILTPDEQSAVQLIESGRADAYGYPASSAHELKRKAGDGADLDVVSPVPNTKIGCGGAVFRKADASFRDAYDKALADIKSDGTFDKIVTSHGFPADVPKTRTRAEFCQVPN